MPSFLVVHQLFFELFDVAHLDTIGVLFVQVKPPKDGLHSKSQTFNDLMLHSPCHFPK